jgi:Protein of unknown function (DUF3303)
VLYMVIERFHGGDPVPVYRRVAERGRLIPEGLDYISSWITQDLSTCYQLMETDDPSLFELWTAEWKDLVDIEVLPVLSSAEVRARIDFR